jgi:hypothetical protein
LDLALPAIYTADNYDLQFIDEYNGEEKESGNSYIPFPLFLDDVEWNVNSFFLSYFLMTLNVI